MKASLDLANVIYIYLLCNRIVISKVVDLQLAGLEALSLASCSLVDVAEDNYRASGQSGESCTRVSQFVFSLRQLWEDIAEVKKAVLRAYMQVTSGKSHVNVTITTNLRDPQSNKTIDGGTVKIMNLNKSSGWMELEISELLQNLWSSKSPMQDVQIELTVNIKGSCEGQGRVPLHVINPAAVRSPRRRQRLLKLQPLLVIHGETNQKAATERANTMAMLTDRVGERAKRSLTDDKELGCKLHHLEINFSEVGFGHLILAPRSANINYCSGACYLAQTSREFFLARLPQNVGSGADELPAACCSPSELQSLAILIRIQGVVAIQAFSNLVVSKCACGR